MFDVVIIVLPNHLKHHYLIPDNLKRLFVSRIMNASIRILSLPYAVTYFQMFLYLYLLPFFQVQQTPWTLQLCVHLGLQLSIQELDSLNNLVSGHFPLI